MWKKKPRKILVPVDLSEASRAGLRLAAEMARRFEAAITVLHVETSTAAIAEVLASTGSFPEAREASARHLEAVEARVHAFVKETLGPEADPAVFIVEDIFVGEAIVRFAEEHKSEWICMAAAGRKGWRRLFLGSTAAHVIRHSSVPVLTLRGRRPDPSDLVFDDFHQVLVATDLGEGSEDLIDLGAALAEPKGELTLLHVIEIPTEIGLYGVPLSIPAENIEAARQWTEGALDRLASHVDRRLIVPWKVLEGRPAASILAVEKELQPDVTVLGTHSRHGMEHLMLGSVAERVVREATGPVLVAPTAPKSDD